MEVGNQMVSGREAGPLRVRLTAVLMLSVFWKGTVGRLDFYKRLDGSFLLKRKSVAAV